MARRKYHGLCIGGSLAGQFVTGEGPAIRVSVASPGPLCYDKLCDVTQSAQSASEAYLFHELPFKEGDIGLWIPEGGTIFWAIKEMAETYAMYEDLK